MDQSQNIFDGSNTGCEGQGAYRDLWWRPVTQRSHQARTLANDQLGVVVNLGCLYLGHLSKSAQFPTHRAPDGFGREEWMHLHQMIRLIEGHALNKMLLMDVDGILPGVFAG